MAACWAINCVLPSFGYISNMSHTVRVKSVCYYIMCNSMFTNEHGDVYPKTNRIIKTIRESFNHTL